MLANVLADPIGDLGKHIIDEPTTRYLVSWGITFIAVLLVFGVIAAFNLGFVLFIIYTLPLRLTIFEFRSLFLIDFNELLIFIK